MVFDIHRWLKVNGPVEEFVRKHAEEQMEDPQVVAHSSGFVRVEAGEMDREDWNEYGEELLEHLETEFPSLSLTFHSVSRTHVQLRVD